MLEPDGRRLPGTGAAYERKRVLPALLARDAGQFGTREPEATLRVLAALAGARRRERARAGSAAYDLERHFGLTQAIGVETGRLGKQKRRSREGTALKHPPD